MPVMRNLPFSRIPHKINKFNARFPLSRRQGILFALRKNPDGAHLIPPNLSFLEILCEFVNRLMKQDRRVV